MSLQLPAILSPPTPCIPSPALTVSPLERSPKLPCPLRVGVRFWASLTLRKLANASGRIVFNIALFMDWQFISGCLPPRLSTTQFPSTTDSQCSVRWGLPPHGWCALSGARRAALPRMGVACLGNFPLLIRQSQPFLLRSLLLLVARSMNVQRRSRGSVTLPITRV